MEEYGVGQSLESHLPTEVGKSWKEQNQRLGVLSSRLKADISRKVESASGNGPLCFSSQCVCIAPPG